MFFDTHVHTTFSTDSRMTLTEALDQAQALELGLILTEHMDLAYPEPEAFTFNVEEYFATYGSKRSDSLLLGIEVGMRDDCVAANRSIIAAYPFDFVIGSIHLVDAIDIYRKEFYLGRSKEEVYHQYFNTMATCLEQYDFYDSLGHIDYICRYAYYDDPELYYVDFKTDIDPVLSLVAQRDKALEINTRRLCLPEAVEALLPIYQRFHELGGRFVTIGSDAHRPQNIGRDLNLACEIAEHCQLTPVYFKDRKPCPAKY